MEPTGTILDTLRAALRSPRQTIQSQVLEEGLEQYKLKQAIKRGQEAKQAENRTSADSGTLPPELEDLSRIFED